MQRRGFLSAILAAGVAPAFVGSSILMPVRALALPQSKLTVYGSLDGSPRRLYVGKWPGGSMSFPTLAAAIAVSQAGDTILLAADHKETLSQPITFPHSLSVVGRPEAPAYFSFAGMPPPRALPKARAEMGRVCGNGCGNDAETVMSESDQNASARTRTGTP
jgi:hypothetical protein